MITNCKDQSKWYSTCVGEIFPLLEIEEKEYKTLEKSGLGDDHRFINFVSKEDAEVIDE